MKEIIEYLVKNIVKYPQDVVIEQVKLEGNTNREKYTIKTNQEDLGVVIGKGGKTIRSIINICKIKAIKENKFIEVEVLKI